MFAYVPIGPPLTGICSGLWDVFGTIRARQSPPRLCSNTALTRPTRPSPSYRSTAEGTTRATLASRRTSTSSTLRPWRTRPCTSPAADRRDRKTGFSLVSLHPRSAERPTDNQYIVLRLREELPAGLCNIRVLLVTYARLGKRGVSILFGSGDDGVGRGDCVDGSGKVQFVPPFPHPASVAIFPRLASSTQAQVQVAHHTATVSQVPGSPVSAERQTGCRRSQQVSQVAASRTTLSVRATSSKQCPPSSVALATNVKAPTSVFVP